MSILQNPNLKNIKLAKPRERRVSAAHGLRFISSLCFFPSLGLSPPVLFLPWRRRPIGGVICPVFAQPFAGDERILQVCAPLLFPSAVRGGAPQTLTKLSVFGSESSYDILLTSISFAKTHVLFWVRPWASSLGILTPLACGLMRACLDGL